MKLFRITITLFLVIAMATAMLSGCASRNPAEEVEAEDDTTIATSAEPTAEPQLAETKAETMPKVTDAPKPTEAPTSAPTQAPATQAPTPTSTPAPAAPATPAPTPAPTQKPAPATPAPTPAPTQKPAETHTHSWTEQTKTVHHDEVTEQVKVVDQPATEGWYEEGTYREAVVCQGCGASFGSVGDWSDHANFYFWEYYDESHSCYRVDMWREPGAYHEGTPEVSHYETRVVSPAWDETVVTGYTCACGATKAA